jgi:hypothetical protein
VLEPVEVAEAVAVAVLDPDEVLDEVLVEVPVAVALLELVLVIDWVDVPDAGDRHTHTLAAPSNLPSTPP